MPGWLRPIPLCLTLLAALAACTTDDTSGSTTTGTGGSDADSICLEGAVESCEPLCAGTRTCEDGSWTACSPCEIEGAGGFLPNGGSTPGGSAGEGGLANGGASLGGTAGSGPSTAGSAGG